MSLSDHEPAKKQCVVGAKLEEIQTKNPTDGATFKRWLTGESLGAAKISTYIRAEGYGTLGEKSIVNHRTRRCLCYEPKAAKK